MTKITIPNERLNKINKPKTPKKPKKSTETIEVINEPIITITPMCYNVMRIRTGLTSNSEMYF